MGCDQGASNERPIHSVWVDRLQLARTATTNRLYQVFIQETARNPPPDISVNEKFNHPDQPGLRA